MVVLPDEIVDDVGGERDGMPLLVCGFTVECLGFHEDRPFFVTGVEYDHVRWQPLVFLQLHHHPRLQVFPVRSPTPIRSRDVRPVFVRVAAVLLCLHV